MRTTNLNEHDLACHVRDIACIKPTVEKTDPAFAVGMQASCRAYDCAVWYSSEHKQMLVAQSCEEDTDLVNMQGFQSTLYTARRVLFLNVCYQIVGQNNDMPIFAPLGCVLVYS